MTRVILRCLALSLGFFAVQPGAEAGCQAWIRNETQFPMMVSIEDPIAHKPLADDDVLLGPNNMRPVFLNQVNDCNRVVVLRVAIGPGTLKIKEISAQPVSTLGIVHIFAIRTSDLVAAERTTTER
jgi:hypothetical protein